MCRSVLKILFSKVLEHVKHFSYPLASLVNEKHRLYGRSKKVTFQSDSCLDSGFSQVCGGLI